MGKVRKTIDALILAGGIALFAEGTHDLLRTRTYTENGYTTQASLITAGVIAARMEEPLRTKYDPIRRECGNEMLQSLVGLTLLAAASYRIRDKDSFNM